MGKYCAPGGTLAISDGWAEHRARGSLGGTDYLDGYGTPIRAMADGVVVMVDSNPDGSGGRMITIRHNDSDSTEVLHADRWIVARGTVVTQGQIVGYSGGSGFGADRYYGSHTHGHGVHADGVRFDVQPHVQHVHPLGSTAGSGTTPVQGENDMSMDTIRHPNGSISFADEMGSEDAGTYRSPDIGLGEYLDTISRVFGGWDQLSAREFDIAVAIAQRRWANKKAQIVNEVVAKLTPVITGAKPVIDPALIKATIKEGLAGLAIEADVDDETIAAIANKVADVQHERLSA